MTGCRSVQYPASQGAALDESDGMFCAAGGRAGRTGSAQACSHNGLEEGSILRLRLRRAQGRNAHPWEHCRRFERGHRRLRRFCQAALQRLSLSAFIPHPTEALPALRCPQTVTRSDRAGARSRPCRPRIQTRLRGSSVIVPGRRLDC